MANNYMNFNTPFNPSACDYDVTTLNEVVRSTNNENTLAYGLSVLQSAGGPKEIVSRTAEEAEALFYSLLNVNREPAINSVTITNEYNVGFQRAILCKVRRIEIVSGTKKIVAYHMNPNKGNGKCVFAIHGHFGDYPSKLAMGLVNGLGEAKILARIAPMGYEVICYDDSYNTAGATESTYQTLNPDTILHTLEDTMIVEKALLRTFNEVSAMGLSGGCQRLLYYLITHKSNLKKAYCAGYSRPVWRPQDADVITTDERLEDVWELAYNLQIGYSKGIKIKCARNRYESGEHAYYLLSQIKPYLEGKGINIQYGGDDPSCNNSGFRVHEYYIEDLINFLQEAL